MSGSRSFDYVRRHYGVPAKRGMCVIANGQPGRITSGADNYIRVLLEGDKYPSLWHPTWKMVYLTDASATASSAGSPQARSGGSRSGETA